MHDGTFVSSASLEETTSETEEEAEKLPILTGVQKRENISTAPYDTWFGPTYSVYAADKETLDILKPLLKDVKIKIFMGTWCEDSQREVPQFFKILDEFIGVRGPFSFELFQCFDKIYNWDQS